VVNDNQSLNQEKPHFDEVYHGNQRGGARSMWTFAPTNFAKVAEAFGCSGIRVERPADLPAAFADAYKSDKLVVIDAVSDENIQGPRAWG